MNGDAFGNLEEWGRVMNQLDCLKRSHELDRHQNGLIRLLRYRENWRLREAALECVRDLTHPSQGILCETLLIMMDEDLYYEVRILAAEALGELMKMVSTPTDTWPAGLRQRVTEQMHVLLDSHQPPIMHQAVRRSLPTIP